MIVVLRNILLSLEAIISVLLIGIILIQKAKGGGLGLAFGGGGESLFGSRAGNVLTKGTVILAIAFMINTVALAILYARTHDRTLMDDHMGAPVPVLPTAQPIPAGMETTPAPATQIPPTATTPAPAPEIPVEMDASQPLLETTIPIEQNFDIGSPTPTPPTDVERPAAE